MQIITEFRVVGRPAPQGSKTPLGRGRFMEQSPHLKNWRNDVRNAAMQHYNGEALIDGPIFTQIAFLFRRPNNHYRSNNPARPLKDDAPFWHVGTPDNDKLQRATNDALTGVIWTDDCRVAATLSQKLYTEDAEGAIIRVSLLTSHSPLSPLNL
jgi:Holliday junction resolvase RusA-like endonuclease